MIQWHYFPKSRRPTELAMQVVAAFKKVAEEINSKTHKHESNQVLGRVADGLLSLGSPWKLERRRLTRSRCRSCLA